MKRCVKPVLLSAILGGLWSLLALATGWLFGEAGSTFASTAKALAGGIIAAPLIGMLMGLASKLFWRSGAARFLVPTITLYLAAFSFVLASQWFLGVTTGRRPDHLLAGSLASLYILTASGFVFVLWPLSYLTHRLVARAWLGARDQLVAESSVHHTEPTRSLRATVAAISGVIVILLLTKQFAVGTHRVVVEDATWTFRQVGLPEPAGD
jgi:hypothetical protein